MTLREWQLRLKAELRPEQYRLVTVVEEPPGHFTARILHPESRAPIAAVPLEDPQAAAVLMQTQMDHLMPARPRDVTIIPHYAPKG